MRRLLGEILISKGQATPEQVKEAWRRQMLHPPFRGPRLGELLVSRGFVTPTQVEEALKVQAEETTQF